MNINTCMTKSIQLINQYSVNGSLISSNNNSDYTLRMANLIDTAQKELANIFPIIANETYSVEKVTNPTDFTRLSIPSNVKKIKEVILSSYPTYEKISYIIEGRELLISPDLEGNIIINYYKIPDNITSTTDVSTDLENTDDIQQIIPYYVAGHVYMEDSPSIAIQLLNEYESKIRHIDKAILQTPITIENVYEGFGW